MGLGPLQAPESPAPPRFWPGLLFCQMLWRLKQKETLSVGFSGRAPASGGLLFMYFQGAPQPKSLNEGTGASTVPAPMTPFPSLITPLPVTLCTSTTGTSKGNGYRGAQALFPPQPCQPHPTAKCFSFSILNPIRICTATPPGPLCPPVVLHQGDSTFILLMKCPNLPLLAIKRIKQARQPRAEHLISGQKSIRLPGPGAHARLGAQAALFPPDTHSG